MCVCCVCDRLFVVRGRTLLRFRWFGHTGQGCVFDRDTIERPFGATHGDYFIQAVHLVGETVDSSGRTERVQAVIKPFRSVV